jgi:hypothetical protein
MPAGLRNTPSTFQRMMDVLLAGMKWNSCLVYLDEIFMFSKTIRKHLQRIDAVLKCLSGAHLNLNWLNVLLGQQVNKFWSVL